MKIFSHQVLQTKKYMKILLINELKFVNESVYDKNIINNIEVQKEKKEHLTYVWKELEELKKLNFKPEIILAFVNNEPFQHIINK